MKWTHIGVPLKSAVFMTLPSSRVTSSGGAVWPTIRAVPGVPRKAQLGARTAVARHGKRGHRWESRGHGGRQRWLLSQ